MKRTPARFALPFIALLSIPFIYNSCQGGLLASKGFSSKQSSHACKVQIENGQLKKIEEVGDAQPAAFASSKVQLRADLSVGVGQSKPSGPVPVPAGSRLGVIINNRCLQENRAELANYPITSAAISDGSTSPDLERQAYEWVVAANSTDDQIEAQAEQEPCLVGISWNKSYTIQAASFNDSSRMYQTHLNSIKFDEAYDRFFNAGGGMSPTTGPSVIVAVVDTGVDWMHPDLQANMWAHQYGMGVDVTTYGGTIDYNPFDVSDIGHGTHVSGLIGAVSNNSTGVVGAMPHRVKIMGIKIFKLNATGGLETTSQHFYNGVKFAYQNGAQVINLSLGSVSAGAGADSVAESAVQEAVAAGSVVTTVIGNAESGQTGRVIDGTTYSSIPGQYSTRAGVIGVGSYDVNSGNKSGFSHFSTTYAEIAAPGAEQGTTGLYSTAPRSQSNYRRLAGTSQAGPLVAAAAAMTIGLIKEATGVSPTPAEVERLILASAEKSTALNTYFKDGNKLNLANLATKINQDYPLTVTGGSTDLSSTGCP